MTIHHKDSCFICKLPLLVVISVIIGGGVAAYRLLAAEQAIEKNESRLSQVEKNVALLPVMQQDLRDMKRMMMENKK
jgi:hypothetical protein